MSIARIRKGDEVIVIAGRDKGRRGAVLSVLDDERVLIENINVVKKHQKPNPNAGIQGGIIEKEMPLHVSNIMLFNPATGKGDRVGVKQLEDGRRVRFFKSNKEVLDA
jgi:large subunit ribosomal protein L24